MPRLLLVDDNPSIHKIAETLLANSDVQLACAASGAEALALIQQGQTFDVALLDISMLGMDGWELLAQLRQHESTARMPVAMMAGVLDAVDPERLRLAPIQGFLKKPVELRDLADRVQRLMETPVQLPEPEPIPELEPMPELDAMPELEPMPEAEPAPATGTDPVSPFTTKPGFHLSDHPELVQRLNGTPDDLLLLTADDLLPSEPTLKHSDAPAAQTGSFRLLEEPLDLEELDMENLRGMSPAPEPSASVANEPEDFTLLDNLIEPETEAVAEPAPAPADIPDFAPGDDYPVTPQPLPEDALVATSELPDLFPLQEELPELSELSELPELPELAPAPATEATPEPEFLDWSDDSDSLVPAPANAGQEASEPTPWPATEPEAASITLSDILDPEPVTAPETELEPALVVEDELLDFELIGDGFQDAELSPAPAPEAEPQTLELEPEAQAQPLEPIPAAEALAPPPADEPSIDPFSLIGGLPASGPVAEPVPAAMAAVEPAPVASASEAEPALPGPDGPDPLAALLADPVLMDRLTKAVVARLSDQALREIAWEVMPELADRLHRN